MSAADAAPDGTLNVLATIDAGYAGPFATLAKSVIANNPGCSVRFFLVHSDIPVPVLDVLRAFCNTGLIVMDAAGAREVMTAERLADCAEDLGRLMVLPDQDVFNVVCGESCLLVDDEIWNYDVRNYAQYKLESRGGHDAGWVMANTAVLHFCGPRKPWRPSYRGRFGMLYRHYMQLAARDMARVLPMDSTGAHSPGDLLATLKS